MKIKNILKGVLTALGLCAACSKTNVLSPHEFTLQYVAALHQASPDWKVEMVKDLELNISNKAGKESTVFLDNAYDSYKQDPASKDSVIQRYISSGRELIESMQSSSALDKTKIVPIIKDRPWLQETRQAMIDRGAKKVPDYVYDDLNPELVILYAVDSPQSIQYLTPAELEKAKIDHKDLRALAIENLKRLIPKMDRVGGKGFYLLTAGGDYEVSCLLLDSIWNQGQFPVDGDIVVAIPARDMLIITGSKDPQGLEKMKGLVEKTYNSGAYRLTKQLFVFKGGKLETFQQ